MNDENPREHELTDRKFYPAAQEADFADYDTVLLATGTVSTGAPDDALDAVEMLATRRPPDAQQVTVRCKFLVYRNRNSDEEGVTLENGEVRTPQGFAFDNELPASAIVLADFDIDQTPVSAGKYLEFVEAGGWATMPGEKTPNKRAADICARSLAT